MRTPFEVIDGMPSPAPSATDTPWFAASFVAVLTSSPAAFVADATGSPAPDVIEAPKFPALLIAVFARPPALSTADSGLFVAKAPTLLASDSTLSVSLSSVACGFGTNTPFDVTEAAALPAVDPKFPTPLVFVGCGFCTMTPFKLTEAGKLPSVSALWREAAPGGLVWEAALFMFVLRASVNRS